MVNVGCDLGLEGSELEARRAKDRLRLEIAVFFEEGGTGGMILQIPYLEASFSILKM